MNISGTPVIAGIILAAGNSSRMGRPKQLLDWDGAPLVRLVAEYALASQLNHVLVVVGAAAEQVTAALDGLPLSIVNNPEYATGQGSSLRVGMTALAANVDAALILLGDQPFVTPPVIDRLLDRWLESRAPIVAPSYRGQRGNPVLFERQLFAQLAVVEGDQGAREILRARAAEVDLVPFDDDRPLLDIDTPEDYNRTRPLW